MFGDKANMSHLKELLKDRDERYKVEKGSDSKPNQEKEDKQKSFNSINLIQTQKEISLEMIDVLKKLEELQLKVREVAKAIEQVKQTNPKDVDTNAVESETNTKNRKRIRRQNPRILQKQRLFILKGLNIYKLKGDDALHSKMYKQERSAHQDATAKKGTDDLKTYTP